MVRAYPMVRPDYVKVRIPSGESYLKIRGILEERALHTVCQEARCPNIAECWESGTATFMILGKNCSRGCRFCSVTHGRMTPPDPLEPQKVAEAVRAMNLDYAVITSVDRDDLPDQGSSHFAAVIETVKKEDCLVEALIPDFQGNLQLVERICSAHPDVISHNIETVRRLTPTVRDRRAGYDQSLSVLSYIADRGIIAKSSIMLGLGETDEEVLSTMEDLLSVGVRILTLGQYLRPSKMQIPVAEYCSQERFNMFRDKGMEMGFDFVASGPLVRSSYKAAEAYFRREINGKGKINTG